MNLAKFVSVLPASALADVIRQVWDDVEPSDDANTVLRVCWQALRGLVGVEAAYSLVFAELDAAVDLLMDVVRVPTPATVDDLRVMQYELEALGKHGDVDVRLERRLQGDGTELRAILEHGAALSKDGHWVYEPMTRTPEYLSNTRPSGFFYPDWCLECAKCGVSTPTVRGSHHERGVGTINDEAQAKATLREIWNRHMRQAMP